MHIIVIKHLLLSYLFIEILMKKVGALFEKIQNYNTKKLL